MIKENPQIKIETLFTIIIPTITVGNERLNHESERQIEEKKEKKRPGKGGRGRKEKPPRRTAGGAASSTNLMTASDCS